MGTVPPGFLCQDAPGAGLEPGFRLQNGLWRNALDQFRPLEALAKRRNDLRFNAAIPAFIRKFGAR